jgi:hypothetical protein
MQVKSSCGVHKRDGKSRLTLKVHALILMEIQVEENGKVLIMSWHFFGEVAITIMERNLTKTLRKIAEKREN